MTNEELDRIRSIYSIIGPYETGSLFHQTKAHVLSLLQEVDKLRVGIRKHRDYRGDDRCWLDNEELYSLLPEEFKRTDLALHEPEAMLRNCSKFIASCQPEGVPYVSPQREIERLTKALGMVLSLQEEGVGGEDIAEVVRGALSPSGKE